MYRPKRELFTDVRMCFEMRKIAKPQMPEIINYIALRVDTCIVWSNISELLFTFPANAHKGALG